MKLKIVFVLMIMGLGSLTAQTFIPQKYSSNHSSEIKKAAQTIKILAVMVEFQPDKFNLTQGDGTFGTIYSKDYGNSIIDPLPHNKSYFEDHLLFAKNYYQKSSSGLVEINYSVLSEIITVSKFMRDYSPVESESFKSLGDFSTEVWTLTAQQNPTLDFSQYNLFVIFHAGVGKDISTSTLLGEPRDLPSLYLSQKVFKEFYGESFAGIEVNNGVKISNSIIIPETESREEEGFGGNVLIELSINGLLVSNIASYLGLPDLFDAETGKSAIGRFGLMDGQSLFAYAGLFPPQPSAWEKVFLGWEEPVIIESAKSNINVVADQIANEQDFKIVKVPINSTEYYLIENRQRDANNNGITVTYKVDGQLKTINFNKDLDNFNNAIVDTLNGVVLDIDEFDWAIPGSGILIWHIDEKIINENLAANRINIGKNRGVDLEEADGIQDIGETFQSIFGDIIIGEGDKFDFWYSSNTSKLYENKFGVDTKPNTNSNSGANSLITFSNFSDISNAMSFDLSFANNNITSERTIKKDETLNFTNLKIITNGNSGFALAENNLYKIDNSNIEVKDFSNHNFVIVENGFEQTIIIGGKENKLNIVSFTGNIFESLSLELSSTISAPIIVKQNSESEISIYLGMLNGQVLKYNYNLQTKALPILEETIPFFTDLINSISILDMEIVAVSGKKIKYFNGEELELPFNIKQTALTKTKLGKYLAITLTDNNMFSSLEKGLSIGKIIQTNNLEINSFSLGDIKRDGENYILFNQANEIKAINLDGSFAENFPFKLNTERTFEGSPLAADIDGDDFSDIISTTSDGNIYAISGKSGKIISGFPLSIGGTFAGTQTIVKRENDLLLSAVTIKNEFYFWSITTNGRVDWGSEAGNNFNMSSLGEASSNQLNSTFFPKNKTYNWPNPVYGNETFIRTYVAEDSQVRVKIFDLAGDLVDEFGFLAIGGIDSETTWNVNNIQSGAYLAHLEVTSNSGKTDSKIIKIAIVK